jgi:hypothetical protein
MAEITYQMVLSTFQTAGILVRISSSWKRFGFEAPQGLVESVVSEPRAPAGGCADMRGFVSWKRFGFEAPHE